MDNSFGMGVLQPTGSSQKQSTACLIGYRTAPSSTTLDRSLPLDVFHHQVMRAVCSPAS